MKTQFQIGEIRIHRVVESEMPLLDPLQLFADATAEALAAQMHWLAPRFYDPRAKKLIVPIQGFVVKSQDKVIVVDTCVGDCKRRNRPEFNLQNFGWEEKLKSTGILPDRVDYVVCTHFHVDHVGWNTRLADGRWVPTFPNARYLFTKPEWEYWTSAAGKKALERAGDYLADSVTPIVEAGLADFVPMDHQVLDGIQLVPAAGHTPGFVCVDVRSGSERMVLAGDLLHTPLQCVYPQWSTRFCTDADASRRTRLRLLEEWADAGTVIMPTHFPSPSAGIVKREHGAFFFHYTDVAPSRSR